MLDRCIHYVTLKCLHSGCTVGIDNGKFYTYFKDVVLNIYAKLQDEGPHNAPSNLILKVCECTGQAIQHHKWKGAIQIKQILMQHNSLGCSGHHESWPVQKWETLVFVK